MHTFASSEFEHLLDVVRRRVSGKQDVVRAVGFCEVGFLVGRGGGYYCGTEVVADLVSACLMWSK
jgi:hypothetical protein